MPPDCEHGQCDHAENVHLFACGWRCPSHTPAALAGRPEPDVARYCAPFRCYCGGCPSYDRPLEPVIATVVDMRAVASGKRRARSVAEYRDARAQVHGGRE